ncbi:hypothetical protein [Spirosoma panaciterrae]|uniref:hypothetical protein n=1 Tax=Spirosoma panaciterrae TaxID=496058 RepID=UPI00036DF585|nr:hypothetical protein [Spirosoma panaciterrae]
MLWLCCLLLSTITLAQTGNYVFSGGEAANFGTISLTTSTSWGTARTSPQGYFAAYGTATYTGADDTHNINGYVKHYVQVANQGFTFPVGTGSDLRALTTSGSIANGLVVGTAWILGNPGSTTDPTDGTTHSTSSLGTGITAVSTVGQWDWVVSSGSAAGVTVSVSIPDVSALGPATQLRLIGWNGSQWVNLSGSSGASGNTENSTLSGTMQSGITAIGIGLSTPPAAGTIDCAQTQLNPAPVSGTPGQVVLVVTVNITSPGVFPVTVSGSGMSLANGVTSVTATSTGTKQFYIPLDYDGSTLGTLNFTIGSAGSCSANLTSPPKQTVSNVWTLSCVPTVGPALK